MARKSKPLSMLQIGLIGAAVLALVTYLAMKLVLGDDATRDEPTVDEAPLAEEAVPAPATPAAPIAATAEPAESITVRPNDSLVSRSRSANLTGTEPVAGPRIVATGEVVPYAELGRHIGARVQVTTKMGTVRHGTVLDSNAYESHLQLDAADGGFKLKVPADSVAQIRLIPGA